MTRGNGVRQYRACVRCRTRKTRCDLHSVGELGKPPCAKCVREGAECVLAGSRRGGDFTHFRRPRQQLSKKSHPGTTRFKPSADHVSPRQHKTADGSVHDSLQNPSDALLILAHAAGKPVQQESESTPGTGNEASPTDGSRTPFARIPAPAPGPGCRDGNETNARQPDDIGFSDYPLIQNGALDPALLVQLLRQYATNYHQFLPIAPGHTLRQDRILETIKYESFLLTTILVVASKDRPDLVETHKAIWNHMRQLILDVVLGMASVRNVGCVEGLLLLGEWTLLNQGQSADGGEGAAWSILGLAVRLAYLLRLEDSGFKGGDDERDGNVQRERLAWTFTYLSDRQISIRMGQAFWCRGPSLSARFTAKDFPALQPRHPGDEDFASLLQAHVELTTLFGNAHDILFASRSRTAELMTRGDYTKYVDDTTRAMAAWERSWGSISVSPHLRSCLALTYEYLRLYVNAFAFQAVLYRASEQRSSDAASDEPSRASFYFQDSAMASPDARHIYAAIDAAETMLKIVAEDIDPEKHLRYMPARFYLYEIHSAVFLYKAHAVEAISADRHVQMTALMQKFISVLTSAAVDENHIASRYAKLLERLWFLRSNGPATGNHGRVEDPHAETGDVSVADSFLAGPDMSATQLLLYDDISLQPFDCTDNIDALFAMPPVFPLDQPGFPGNAI